MQTDATIHLSNLVAATISVGETRPELDRASAKLRQIEPYLAGFLENHLTHLAGSMAVAGAPTPLVQQSVEQALALVLIVFQAQRSAGLQLWRETHAGTPLARLDLLTDPSPAPPDATPDAPAAES